MEVIQDLGKEISKGRLSQQTLVPVEVHEPSGGPLQTLSTLISPLLSPLATTGLIVVFVNFHSDSTRGPAQPDDPHSRFDRYSPHNCGN
jgi:hypothetical protein